MLILPKNKHQEGYSRKLQACHHYHTGHPGIHFQSATHAGQGHFLISTHEKKLSDAICTLLKVTPLLFRMQMALEQLCAFMQCDCRGCGMAWRELTSES